MDKKIEIVQGLMRICGSIVVYLAAYLLVLSLAGSISAFHSLHSMYLNAAAMGIAAIVLGFTIKREEYKCKCRTNGNKWICLIAVVLLAYGSSAFFNILLGSIPWQEFAGADAVPDENVFFGIPIWGRMLCYELIAPVAEELLFRQVIFIRLKKIAPVWLAVTISALAFGIYHGNPVQGIYAFIMGIILALVYECSGSLLFPILFHMIANHLSDICYEFPQVGQMVYSVPGAIVSAVMIALGFWLLYKKQNKCSKNALQSSK